MNPEFQLCDPKHRIPDPLLPGMQKFWRGAHSRRGWAAASGVSPQWKCSDEPSVVAELTGRPHQRRGFKSLPHGKVLHLFRTAWHLPGMSSRGGRIMCVWEKNGTIPRNGNVIYCFKTYRVHTGCEEVMTSPSPSPGWKEGQWTRWSLKSSPALLILSWFFIEP